MSQLDFNSPSVQSYLTILQDVISRMASNSAGSKTWCIAIVSAILVVIADRNIPDLVWIALAPIVVFLFLDAYYLGMERRFRDRYNDFITKLHSNTAQIEDVFVVVPAGGPGKTLSSTLSAMASFSVWPFYAVQIAILIAIRFVLLA